VGAVGEETATSIAIGGAHGGMTQGDSLQPSVIASATAVGDHDRAAMHCRRMKG